MTVTGKTGSSVVITCDLARGNNYIHWYQFEQGKVPQHLLYYDYHSSTVVVDLGISSSGKYHAYESTRSYKFVIRYLQESDSASQASSNLERRILAVTGKTGSSAEISCDFLQLSPTYVHWYQFQEGKPPRRFLYYDYYRSSMVVDSGISPAKYHAYAITRSSFMLVIRRAEERDSGVYYCAAWERHSDSDLPCTTLKIIVWLLLVPSVDQPPPHFWLPASLYSEQWESQSSEPSTCLT
ncbi:T-cell receptor gamma chain V region PT-gamma-1/2 [Tupaia chinensis]|nr:T-cell receptor gamma chain V region PT-gamma-1/2 [Tupaia chinensis]